jgi:hypothetical protein
MKNIESTEFRLTLTGRQAWIIMRALELLSRIHMGQVDEIRQVLGFYEIPRTSTLETHLPRDSHFPPRMTRGQNYHDLGINITQSLDYLKENLFPELTPNEFWGITNTQIPEDARISWDLYQVIRYHTSWESVGWPKKRDWETMLTVNYDEPMKTSTEKLAGMETIS